ncbi:hypothetical protein M422DRAFT_32535 [Sphaerobolus stellatus SS14]|uniref:Uncharacterized protein n=1 Tax=Sphaerobolus stellatus (strain SS14) TaxID=990650 RepID=A0A0C9VPA0_SPHS4|nr:hypothetical protein M422DRAFT_32535 [Sphaerobolus stellatus SS14]
MPQRTQSRSPTPERYKERSSHKRHRSRSRDKDRRRSRSVSRDRDRSEDRSDSRALPPGIEPISEDDYFLKNAEFSRWLRVEKGKYFNELRSDKTRSYFRKFVKAWNRGKLADDLYSPIDPISVPSSQQTSYKWGFASAGKVNQDELRRVRDTIGGDTYGPSRSNQSRGRVLGPTLPSTSDLQLAREESESLAATNKFLKRKREKMEEKERVEDLVGPKPVGKEGLLEKKRAKRESDKTFREAKEDAGLEVSEDVLMGGNSSFKEAIARRDAARARWDAKKKTDPREQDRNERAEQLREKDRKTMEMFKQMAKERFG